MDQTASKSPSFLLSALGMTLRREPLVHLTLVVFVFTTSLYWLPLLSPSQLESLSWSYGPLVFLVLVVFSLLHGLHRVAERTERRFWIDLSAAFSCWLAAMLLRLVLASDSLMGWFLEEALYTLYYITLVLAAMREPDVRTRWRPLDLERRLAWPTAVLIVLGLLGYFVLVPVFTRPEGELSVLPSLYYYVTLDFFLAGKLCYLAWAARAPRWRALYTLVAMAFVNQLVVDLLEAVGTFSGQLAWGSKLDPVWNLSFVGLVLAARLRHAPVLPPRGSKEEAERITERLTGLSGQALIFALVLPLVHFVLHRLGLLETRDRPAREVFALWWLLGLGTIALIQHRFLKQRTRSLWLARQRAERSLRDREQNLRVMLERREAEEVIQAAEQRFAAVFYHSPDGLMISTLADGRFLDVNPTAERLTGYNREELLNGTSLQLQLWESQEARTELLQALKRLKRLRDWELTFEERGGRRRVVLASFEMIRVEGTPCVLYIMRDITARKRAAAAVTAQAALVEGAKAAIVVLDAAGCIADWNPGAVRLFGWPATETIGRHPAELFLPPGEEEQARFNSFLNASTSATTLLWATTRSGDRKQIEARCTLVCDGRGKQRARILLGRETQPSSARSVHGAE